MKLYDLKTNNRKENLLADTIQPVFGWKADSSRENVRQTGYRITVWDEAGEKVWDSGTVQSSHMTGIPYEGETLRSGERYTWEVEGTFTYGSTESGDRETETVRAGSWFETGYFHRTDWEGEFIGETADQTYHLYRKTFTCGQRLRQARLYVCTLGHFECRINGNRVSDHVLEPGWSDYRRTCFYTKYDVTESVQSGDNAVVVKLGDGMYHVPGGRYVYFERSYGKCKFLFQLELIFEDGSRQLVVSDSTWRQTKSPILFCCIYGGEDYDGRLWREEYLRADYEEEEGLWESAVCVDWPEAKLRAMPMEPMKVMETYAPVSVREAAPGVWQYDLGKNFSGWVRIRLRTDGRAAGQKILLKPAEKLGKDGRIDQSITRDDYVWTYILDEKEEQEFAPDFTYTGFRYVEVTGALPEGEECERPDGKCEQSDRKCERPDGKCAQSDRVGGLPVISALTGEFLYPDVEQAGGFECSNQLFNDIHEIVLQAILSNTKSYFTDCPHREKLGWLEETHLIGPSIMYNLDVHNLYAKVEQDIADSQRENGMVPDICPEYVTGFERWHEGFVDSPEWGSASILTPWYVYKRYGDSSLLKQYYPVMRRYLDYLGSRTHHEILHHGLGDWLDIGPCTPHSQNTPVPVTATCIYYYDLDVMKKTAELLGYEDDAQEYAGRMERVFREYNLQFLDDQTGRYATGSQAAQAMSLMVGLVPEKYEKQVVKQLRDDVVKRGFAITAGDVGHPFLVRALMKYGMSDVLNEMTNITDRPGYGYQVVNGATTLTEEWDGPDPACTHGSQNHLMLGSIEEWFYGSLGGMELIHNGEGLDEISIEPHPQQGLDYVKAWVMHPYGRISVEWEKKGEVAVADVVIPPNVTARLKSSDGTVQKVVGSGRHRYEVPV